MRTTPPHLQLALACVKRYIEKMPEGANLTQITKKVAAYRQLSRRDKDALIEVIRAVGTLCVVSEGKATVLHHPKFGHKSTAPVAPKKQEIPVEKKITPEQLRRQAEELIRAAEEVEKKTSDRAEIKRQLDPLKLEIFQAYGMASRKFDEFIDAMADMGNVVEKLKQIAL